MLLTQTHTSKDEYICELTKELDIVAGLSTKEQYHFFYHYILADKWCKKNKCLAIRVPGGTVGALWINDKKIITDIVIDPNYVIKTYPKEVSKILEKYIGKEIEFN